MPGSDDEIAALHRQLDRLESRLEQVEGADGTPRLSERRALEIRNLVTRLVADAETRTSLADDDVLGGWDDGFRLRSADGQFRLEVSGQLQTRYVWNRRQDGDEHETLHGYEVRRAKVRVRGYLHGPELGYAVSFANTDEVGRNDVQFTGMRLQSYAILFRVAPQLQLALGRARPPLLREEQVSSRRQLAAERSLVARAFRQTRSLGIRMRYQTDVVRIMAGFMDSSGELFSNLHRPRVSGRGEVLLIGKWKYVNDFSSFREDPVTVALGAGVFYQQTEFADPALPDTETLRWSADITAGLGGANFFASYVGNHAQTETLGNFNQAGVVVQGGLFVTDQWELFGRYEWGDADGVSPNLTVLTVGANRFFEEHQLKFTADFGYGFTEVGDFWATSGAGWLEDEPGENGQIVIRAQFQLLF